jgi:hypothetical protein
MACRTRSLASAAAPPPVTGRSIITALGVLVAGALPAFVRPSVASVLAGALSIVLAAVVVAPFDPYRWTPERQAQRPKFSYFPFGGGPRLWVGESFAWMEGMLLLATLAQCWRLRLAADQLVAPQPSITLRPRYGMRMVIERRAK